MGEVFFCYGYLKAHMFSAHEPFAKLFLGNVYYSGVRTARIRHPWLSAR